MPEERSAWAEAEAARRKWHLSTTQLCPRVVSLWGNSGETRRLPLPGHTLQRAVCLNVVYEETGSKHQQDEQQAGPVEAPALHFLQQQL